MALSAYKNIIKSIYIYFYLSLNEYILSVYNFFIDILGIVCSSWLLLYNHILAFVLSGLLQISVIVGNLFVI